MRILFLYAQEPSGHASVAAALEAAAREAGHETRRLAVVAEHPLLGPFVADLYLSVVQRAPNLWERLYESEAVGSVAREWRKAYAFLAGDRMRSRLSELAPTVVVCSHAAPLAALAVERAKGRLPFPLAGVLTDFSAHSYWPKEGADLYLASCPEAAGGLERLGVPRALIRETGIPVHPSFARRPPRDEARRLLGLPPGGPVILLSGGSRGLGKVREGARRLLDGLPQARILALCGQNQALFDELSALEGGGRLKAFRGLDAPAMGELMAAADLLVGKAGGSTAAEALALGLPMLVFGELPGPERRNAEYLCARGAGVRAELADLAGSAARLLEGPLQGLRARALALGRPRAAAEAVAHVEALARD